MLQGLRTVIYKVDDLEAAKDWFSRVAGKKPYFDQPFYVGFDVGGFELGLDPDIKGNVSAGSGLAYWGVSDAAEAVKRLVQLGAHVVADVKHVGEGIKVAVVRSPFGHEVGLIENPHFKHQE